MIGGSHYSDSGSSGIVPVCGKVSVHLQLGMKRTISGIKVLSAERFSNYKSSSYPRLSGLTPYPTDF